VDTARTACRRLGARIIEQAAPWDFDWDDLSVVLLTEAWAYHRAHAERREHYRPAIAEFIELARKFTGAVPYLAAQRRRTEGTATWERWFTDHRIDLVLEPTLPIVPYGRGPGYDRGHAGGPGDPMIALTALWDMTGMPVAALPVSWEAGISLVAPRGGEIALAQAAIDLQQHALGIPQWPAG
jgi:aspartyl-tRNA(Asn)/glutamyl-tRNA(Gln) amidotransferase subunit A